MGLKKKKKRPLARPGRILAGLALFLLVMPFFVPVTRPDPEALPVPFRNSRQYHIHGTLFHTRLYKPQNEIRGKIVLIHGFGGSTYSFQNMASLLMEEVYWFFCWICRVLATVKGTCSTITARQTEPGMYDRSCRESTMRCPRMRGRCPGMPPDIVWGAARWQPWPQPMKKRLPVCFCWLRTLRSLTREAASCIKSRRYKDGWKGSANSFSCHIQGSAIFCDPPTGRSPRRNRWWGIWLPCVFPEPPAPSWVCRRRQEIKIPSNWPPSGHRFMPCGGAGTHGLPLRNWMIYVQSVRTPPLPSLRMPAIVQWKPIPYCARRCIFHGYSPFSRRG